MLGSAVTAQTSDAPTYALASWLFLRLLCLIYFAAFVSLGVQIKGLVGSQGILPVTSFLQSQSRWGWRRFLRVPTLCWIRADDHFLISLCWIGALLALVLVAGLAPIPLLLLLWIFYLSLFSIGRIFLGYQWDILLLEAGFLGIFLAPMKLWSGFPPEQPPILVLALLWWLLFRLMFSSGIAKLLSGDRTWRNLSALCHHYQTQPLPTVLGWFAYQLPRGFHKVSAAAMLIIEVAVPFLILGPPSARRLAAVLFILLMLLIQLTGNYGFFNVLGIALSVLLLDDQYLREIAALFGISSLFHIDKGVPLPSALLIPVGCVICLLSVVPILRLFRIQIDWPSPLAVLLNLLEPFRLVNSYGLFAVMTTERPEIIIEGSVDGVNWSEYEFRWKPGPITRAPRFAAPHQPRLDWQMWFAALGYYDNHPWLERFLLRLLADSAPVKRLLKFNPFQNERPRFIRTIVFDYRFTDRRQHAATGAWWHREERGAYGPVIEAQEKSPKAGYKE